MKAHLSLGNSGGLIVQLETGEHIVAVDARKLAGQLRLAGVTAESLTVTDWKTDPDHAPTSGTIIAVKAALRGLPPKTTEQMDALFQQHHETLKGLADSDADKEI
jgi:hypothetical protein